MLVIANSGERCPLENQPRKYVSDSAPVDVPDTSYYRRLVREGSLRLAQAKPQGETEAKKTRGGEK